MNAENLATYLQANTEHPFDVALDDLNILKACRDVVDEDWWREAYDKEIEFTKQVLTILL